MINSNYILNEIPSLKLSDTGQHALELMKEFRVAHLPIVESGRFVGLISDEEIFDLGENKEEIGQAGYELLDYAVKEGEHLYGAFKLASDLSLDIVPVIGEQNKYQGYIDLLSMVNAMGELASFNEPGGIIILEISQNDYSVSEIGQIVEGNGAKILSLYVKSNATNMNLEVMVKVNKTNINGILQTFERYDYSVKASFQEANYNQDLKDKYDEFMKYLNM